jgi:hypothetical protein
MSKRFNTGLCPGCGDASLYLRPRITLLMDTSVITAMSGVLDSVVGGSATVATSWVTQRTQSKRDLLRSEIRRCETVYGEFISECSARVLDAFDHQLEQPESLLNVYGLLNRIRLCASDTVLAEAERVVHFIAEQYFSPNLSAEQLRNSVRSRDQDPLKPFGEACRRELKAMRTAV